MATSTNSYQDLLQYVNHSLDKQVFFNRDELRYVAINRGLDLYFALYEIIQRCIFDFFQTLTDVHSMVLWFSKIQFTYVIDIKEIPDAVSGPSHLTQAIFDFLGLVLSNVLNFLSNDNVLLIF